MNYKKEKENLVKHWKRERVVNNKSVLDAFLSVPRENFVLKEYKSDAYHDHPLPILSGQTISQPTTVIIMLDHLKVNKGDNILEIGAGSGYHAALLSILTGSRGKVISTEVVPELVDYSKKNLKKYKNVKVIKVDSDLIGFKKNAPYDKILVTAALPDVPDELYNQLNNGGVLVLPVGGEYSQEMLAITRLKGNLRNIERLGFFQFVPVRGKFGFLP
ncbi:MAG: protein-L-isoaspartate(D-aspartate) O-methyltransferase [Nanoarchaeota archaeon]